MESVYVRLYFDIFRFPEICNTGSLCFPPAHLTPVLTDVNCTGNELDIAQCSSPLGHHGCRTGDIGLMCSMLLILLVSCMDGGINVREYRRGNLKWTIKRNWQHRALKMTKNTTKTQHNICWTPSQANKHKQRKHDPSYKQLEVKRTNIFLMRKS